MSFTDDFLKALKKKNITIETTTKNTGSGKVSKGSGGNDFTSQFLSALEKRKKEEEEESIVRTRVSNKYDDDDIAPLAKEKKVEDESLLDFFQKGAFQDGYQVGDVTKSILGTAGDAALGIAKGAAGVGEGIADLLTYGMSGVADLAGADEFARRTKEYAQMNKIEDWTKGANDFLDQYSVLGRTSDAILQGVGQAGVIIGTGALGGAAGLGTAGTTGLTMGTMGAMGMGSGMSEAYKSGATDGEAVMYGAAAGASDALWELLFGGMGKAINAVGFSKGLSSLDDIVAKGVTKAISNPNIRNVAEFAVKSGFEGLEEVGSGFTQAVAKKLTYMSEEEFGEILQDENLLEQFIVGAATSGIMQSGAIPGTQSGSLKESLQTGRDFVTGYSQNEQAVIQKEIDNRIAEKEADGTKLSKKERAAIEAQVEKDMERGYISTDTIEEALGGETFKQYKHTVDSEDAIQKEFDTLNKMKQGEMTGEQLDRRTELKEKLEYLKKNSKRSELKTKLGEEVMSLVQGDRLLESYNERSRRGKAFQADLTQYDEKQKAVVQKAVESGILNNTNRTHEFVDMVAKISADKGVLFDFTNNAKLKESGFAMDGKTINGYVSENGIAVNIQSAKSLNTVVGHEIAHVLEGTDLYTELQSAVTEYAKTKGDYQGRYDALSKLYEGVEGANIDAELTADLVGDYLFTDSDFVSNLSTEHRNVFQKIYDEVKYLLKVATAGSKEARELEKVKRAFDKAYRETKNTAESGVKYSMYAFEQDGRRYVEVDQDQTRFDGHSIDEYPRIAKDIINEKFNGKVIGTDNKMFVNGAGRDEFANPSKHISDDIYEAKMRTAGELDNLLDAGTNFRNAPDGADGHYHKDVVGGFDYFDTLFKIGDRYFEAVINIKNVAKGKLFKDVTKIKDVTQDIMSSYGENPKSQFLRTSSKDIVSNEGGKVNPKFSISDTTGRELSQEQSEYFKDSKVRDENGNLKVMYHGTPNGDFTVFKDGTYFTDNKEYADRYQNPGASSISTGKTASNPKTFEVYLDIKKPFDLSDPEARRIYIEDYIKGGNAMGINPYLSDAEYAKIETIDWTEGEDLRDFLTENGYGYDGLVLDEGADGGYGDEVQSRGKSYVVFSPEQVKQVDNAKPSGDPDIRFSLSEAVEETKELMAIHNLTGEKLLKSLKMGGLPMPSIAIAKAKDGHGEFGEISLVLNKDTIDPQVSSRNKLYSGDAWTPTYPSVDYKPSEKVLKKVKDKISGLVPTEVREALGNLMFDTDNATSTLSRYNGNMAEAYKQNDAMKYAYLKDTGADISLPTKEADLYHYGQVSNEAVRYFSGKLVGGLQTVEHYRNMSGRDLVQDKALTEAIADAQNFDVLRTMEPGSAEYLEYEQNPVFKAEEVSFRDIDSMLSAARKLLKNGVQQTVDRKAARELISGAVDQTAYENWLDELFAGVVEKEGIRNNKDYFTPSGNRRSFEALHYEHNLENVIKAMREQGEKGIGNGFGGSSIFGASTTEFSSIDEMKRWSDRLKTMSYDEYQELRKSFTDRFLEIAMRLPNEKNSFSATDSAAEVLTEAVAKYKTRNGIANYLRRELKGWATYSDQAVNDLIDLVDDIRSMPTGYFEAKPQRAVGFDEVAAFVIPKDTDIKLKQELLNRGYNIAEYDPNVEGDRQRVLNGFEDLKFSLSDAGAQPRTFGNYNVYGEDVALEAPMQEDIAPVAENATTVSNTESVADLFPDDTAPMQEEYEFLMAERDDIRGAMDAYAAVGDMASAEQLMGEYEAIQARIAEIEADDRDRLASIDETDAPPEVDNNPEDVADNVPLTKKLVDDLTRSVRQQLGLSSKRSNEVRELIQRYSSEEFPSKAHLYTEIAERFGTYTESSVDEDLKGIKSLLRTYGIHVDESIKGEIADYGQVMRSNFGKVRFSKEGLPVDVAYKEFQEVLPGYFPESIYSPTDQLMRIIEVANLDTTIQTEYEIDWQTLEAVTDTIANGVTEFKQARKESLANKHGRESFNSLMASADQYVPPIPEDIAPVRPAIQNVQSSPDDIAPVFDTSSGQQSLMPEEETPKKVTRKDLHFDIMDHIKTYFRTNGLEFDDVLKNAKDLSTFATVDNTPQRVLEKALGYKQGQMLSEMTVNRVARNETEGIQWLNSFTDKKGGLLQKISKQYGIKPGSKASAAAQMYAEGFYVGENDAIIEYGDKELAADFPDTKVQANIKKLARDPRIRQIYDETLAAINESRTRNAYPEIPRLDNYFLHFRAMEDTFSRMGLPFNPNDIRAKDLPTDLNGVTADLKPGQPYFASAMHRTGKRTSFDLLGGLEKYLTSAKNQIYHIDDIQTLRALRNYVAETYGQANGLKDLDLLSDEEAEQRIEAVYNSHLSTFAKFLNEEANVLAGKTSLIDRGLEGVIGRRGITFLDTLNKQVGANMVGFNVSSSLTNFLAPVQAFAKSNKFDFVKAMAQTSYNKIASVFGGGDGFAEQSPVMIRRKGAERFYRTPYQKVADAGYVFMGVVDDISTELIARTKYNELTRKGMSSNQAHYETDKWVSRLMGDRSLGQQPQLYNSKMLGLFTKFQLEVRNQLDSQFYDTIQEAKVSAEQIENKLLRNAKKAAKITSTFAQLAVMQHLFGKAFESVAGYNPAFDIIDALIKSFGWDDEEEDEDTVLDNIEEGFLSLLGDLPYTSTLTGGRIPIASALPVTEFIKGEDQYGNEKNRWQTLGEAAPYYVLPGGYGQIKKTKAGMEMFDEDLPIAGSYTDSGGLRFPVEDNLQNRVQAGLFGQWASETARDYFDNERKPLQEKQIQEFIDVDLPISDYWAYREGLAKHEKLEDKIKYIEGLDLPVSKKNILVNNVTDRKDPIDLTNYDEYGTYEEFDFASKNPEKYDFLQRNNISYSDYQSDEDTKEFYDSVYSWEKNNPEKVTVSKAVTDSVVEYRKYSKDLDAIRADKDKNGKSISGSAKAKKLDYINSLSIDDGAKMILFKNEYNADDTFNYEIIEYLNGRDDVSRDDMITILKELGFEVHSDGTVTW